MEILFVCLSNLGIVGLFVYLSIYFGKWWIVLFSSFYIMSIKNYTKKKNDKNDDNDSKDNDITV